MCRTALEAYLSAEGLVSTGMFGIAIRKCRPVGDDAMALETTFTCCAAYCSVCQRCFATASGRGHHRCGPPARLSAQQRRDFPLQCPLCLRRFRRSQDLGRHRC